MKRLTFILALSFVVLSFGLANAIQFNGYVNPTYFFDDGGTDKLKANTDLVVELQLANNDGIDWCGFSMPLMFYGTGDVTTVFWVDAGGTQVPSIVRVNGFEPGGVWDTKNDLYTWGWDGNLPDTMNHSVLACISGDGWTAADTDLLTRYEFHMNIPLAGAEEGEICLDSVYFESEPDFDWLFDPAQNFGGPFCWPVAVVPNLAPVVDYDNQVNQVTVQWDDLATANFNVEDPDDPPDPIIGAGATLGTAVLSGGGDGTGTIAWSYQPDCDDVGASIEVGVWADDAFHTGEITETFDLVVLNTAPDISGFCDQTLTVGINDTKYVEFQVTDANAGDEKNISISESLDGDVTYSWLDATTLQVAVSPSELDADQVFTVQVCVTDCNDEEDCCNFDVNVISQFPFGVLIEKEEGPDGKGVYQGHHTMVDVTLIEGTERLHGFDFLIAYDASALAFTGAYPGILFDIPGDYEWEYFTYRFRDNCGGSCPSGLLQVIGMAEQNDGPHHPLEFIIPKGTVLFTLDFLVSNDRTLECMYVPIQFFWMDCTDNSLAFSYRSDPMTDVKQGISQFVYAFVDGEAWLDITDPNFGFPTFYGAQEECLFQNPDKTPIPFVWFYDGGVDIICADDIDARGDVNLNGIANEIADAVVFTNYFIYGTTAFQTNVEGQIAATDVNADGIPLSVADLVYLVRVVVGDALPIPKLSPYAEEANFGRSGEFLTVDAEVGAAYYVLEGNADVRLADGAAGMEMKSAFDGNNTRVLVYSFEQGATFSGNILATDANIVSVEAADYFGNALKTVNLPTEFSVMNYPNPFNPSTTIELALPSAANWSINIYNVAGQKVAEFSGYNEAGTVNVVWDASNQASGIYFYKVTADNFSATKKMVLLK